MSKISDAYSAILTRVIAIFPNKVRFPNPYDVQANNSASLRDSWGLKIDSGSLVNLQFCDLSFNRAFTVVLTREIINLEQDYSALDTASKALLDDCLTLQQELYKTSELGIEAKIQIIDLGSASGIETFFADKYNYVKMEISFNITVSEVY